LKPKGAESNLFIYHLKNLIAAGLVKKIEKGYALTTAGERYVDKLSLADLQVRFQPKIVTVIVCKNKNGEYLTYTRKRQPFYGMDCFPYGKIHFGETVAEAAKRELLEKTGLAANPVRRGEAYLTIRKSGELVAHMLCHVFTADGPSGELIAESQIGSCQWRAVKEMNAKNFIPGFIPLFRLAIGSRKPFFKEFTY
jgi:ADP-ribose pyrophosphatase YjhB (NUDIX family)